MSQRRYIVHSAVCVAALAAGVITTSAQAGLLGGIGGSAGGALTNGTLNVIGSGNGQAQGGFATPSGAALMQPAQRARGAASAARSEARNEAAGVKPTIPAPTTPAPAVATSGGANASASENASFGASYSADGSVSR